MSSVSINDSAIKLAINEMDSVAIDEYKQKFNL